MKRVTRVLPCFDKLSKTGINPFALSLSKGAPPGSHSVPVKDKFWSAKKT